MPHNNAWRTAISPSDLSTVRDICDARDPPIPYEQVAFHWNDASECWEAYDRGVVIPDADDRIAFYLVDGSGWTEG